LGRIYFIGNEAAIRITESLTVITRPSFRRATAFDLEVAKMRQPLPWCQDARKWCWVDMAQRAWTHWKLACMVKSIIHLLTFLFRQFRQQGVASGAALLRRFALAGSGDGGVTGEADRDPAVVASDMCMSHTAECRQDGHPACCQHSTQEITPGELGLTRK
jgi:hypothetical protein